MSSVPFTPLAKIASALSGASPGDDDIQAARKLASGLDAYTEKMTSPAGDALAKLEADTRSEDWQGRFDSDETSLPLQQNMLSGNLEGQFLATLIAMSGASRVLEIGLFTGYGALAMAEALGEDGRLTALEIDPYAADFARRHFAASPAGDKIDIIVGPAAQSLDDLASQGAVFDFVFIDADKPGYASYYETLLSRGMVDLRGVICVDNTLLSGEPYSGGPRSENGDAIAAFNEMVAADPRTVQVMLPVRDGVTLIRHAR